MSDTKFSEQNIQNRSFNESLEINENLMYGYDGTNARAIKVDADGNIVEKEWDITEVTRTASGKIETMTMTDGTITKLVTLSYDENDKFSGKTTTII